MEASPNSVKIMLKIMDGPGLKYTQFTNKLYKMVIIVLREMIRVTREDKNQKSVSE